MSGSDKLFKFLDQYKTNVKGSKYTNISISNPKQSFNIPDEKYNKFTNLYSNAIINGATLHFVEKPLNPSALRVDLDFRFTPIYDEYGIVSLNRDSYIKLCHIQNIVYEYFVILYSIFELNNEDDDDEIECTVMLKSKPVFDKNIIKDGIHLIFDNLVVSHKIQYYIRQQILDRANIIFSGIYTNNDYNDVVDKSIIDSNGWQMFKSNKLNCEIYEIYIRYCFNINQEKDDIFSCLIEVEDVINEDDDDDDDLKILRHHIKKYSMRKIEYKERVIKVEKEKKLDEFITQLFPNEEKNKKFVDNMFLTEIRNSLNNRVDDEKIELVKNIVNNCLDINRVDDYNLWMQLGFILRNIDSRLLELWDDFSKNSSKYKAKVCMQKWNSMKDDNLGIGTLIYWAKQDNPDKYNEIINNSLIKYAENAIESLTHYDIALLIYKKFNDEFKFVSKETWYMYSKDEHRYITMIEGIDLSTKISTDIVDIIKNKAKDWACQSINIDLDVDMRQRLLKKIEKSEKMVIQCRLSPFKKNIINECKIFFQSRNFEYELNEKGNLVGFRNGVFDIKKGIEFQNDITDIGFREGSPADFLRFSTNCNYRKYNKDDIIVSEINNFLKKVLPDKDIREYLLIQFALALDGNFKQERFFILAGKAGSGSNGKSTLINLVEKAFGDYFCTMNVSYITQGRAASKDASPDIYRTKGVRIVVMAEPNENDKLNVGKLKEMTGNDTMSCRGLYKEQMEFKPQFSVFLTCNYVPEISSNDDGTWRRIRLIEFTSRFTDDPDPKKYNEFKIDREIPSKIDKWKETFISMLLHIRINMDVNNIKEPQLIVDATKRFYLEQDLMTQFICDKIDNNNESEEILTLAEVYGEYKIWFKQNTNDNKKTLQRAQFNTQLNRNSMFSQNKMKDGNWIHLKIKDVNNGDE